MNANIAVVPDIDTETLSDTLNVTLPTGQLTLRFEVGGPFVVHDLIGFAARANALRGFLFLSKVLGKHWPAAPRIIQAVHSDLSARIPIDFPEPVVFIAMAETAIGLGQGVFETWKAENPQSEVLFLHTTRYQVGDTPILEFEETHSHAPRQFLHEPRDARLNDRWRRARSLVLIDDEATTGNTFFNLSAACRSLNPLIERVHLGAITNFMGGEANAALSKRFGLTVTVGAALTGEYDFTAGPLQTSKGKAQLFKAHAERGASARFGRLGIDRILNHPTALSRRLRAEIGPDQRVLVLGTGEFMHMAFLLACALDSDGVDVVVQSTSRSPIMPWGVVSHVLSFGDNYGEGVDNYLYNVVPRQYDHVFICHETPPNAELHQLATLVQGRLFLFLSEYDYEEIPVC